jgi:hypothetical protein
MLSGGDELRNIEDFARLMKFPTVDRTSEAGVFAAGTHRGHEIERAALA